jgi:hypothetical protein
MKFSHLVNKYKKNIIIEYLSDKLVLISTVNLIFLLSNMENRLQGNKIQEGVDSHNNRNKRKKQCLKIIQIRTSKLINK